jgi:hypothetical protein
MPTSVAKAASYRPAAMPTPITSQLANSPTGPVATDSSSSPAARITLDAHSTERPPCRSISRPASGPSAPDASSAAENAAKTIPGDTPRSRAIGSASSAGR